MSLMIEGTRSLINDILGEWDHFSTHLQNIKDEELEDDIDIYSQIDFLSQLDEMGAILSDKLFRLDDYLKQINTIDKNAISKEQLHQISALKSESQQVLKHIRPKLKIAEESYEEAAEEVLTRCQDHINDLVDKVTEHREQADFLNRDTGFELDEENQLRELRDSLEDYREIRLENIETGEGDPIIDQLDSQIIACDSALLIDESSL